MLRFSSSANGASAQCTPNLLPCRIHCNGPVDASPRYWAPETAKGASIRLEAHLDESLCIIDGDPEAYFRGRKLKGKEIKVPEGYRGIVVSEIKEEKDTTKNLEKQNGGEDPEGEEEETKTLQEVGSFNEIVLWGHERLIDDDDSFVKGMQEWIGFAEAMHKPGSSNGPL